MKDLLISIIVPIYNTEKYLDECVKSLTNQTYQNIELILVDDGSSDSCPQKCDNWAQKNKRIQVIHKPNGGLSDARNVGIEAAHGEFIMFVDSDDFLKHDTIKDLYTLQCNTEADIVCGGFYKYQNNKSIAIYNQIIQSEKVVFTGIEQLKNMLASKTDCSSCGKLYKRSSIGNHRFIKGRYNEDIIFLFSLYASCSKTVYTNKRYYYYRDTAGSITNKLSEKTMHALRNMHEMEQMTIERKMPIQNEMENYKCRTCLEIGYAIQRDNAATRFPNESVYTKSQVWKHFPYMLKHPDYNWKDLIHALIVLIRL